MAKKCEKAETCRYGGRQNETERETKIVRAYWWAIQQGLQQTNRQFHVKVSQPVREGRLGKNAPAGSASETEEMRVAVRGYLRRYCCFSSLTIRVGIVRESVTPWKDATALINSISLVVFVVAKFNHYWQAASQQNVSTVHVAICISGN